MRRSHTPRAALSKLPSERHKLGAGPTIRTVVSVSEESADVAFVQAAMHGDDEAIRKLIPQISSIDVLVRPVKGLRGKGRPATALHLAAAEGCDSVVSILLEARADVTSRMQWLRALTPLHVASTPSVARLLLDAGAQPIALDPREPDASWYHRMQHREDVASAITAWRVARVGTAVCIRRASPVPHIVAAQDFVSSPRKSVVPSMTGPELRAASQAFTLNSDRSAVILHGLDAREPHSKLNNGETERIDNIFSVPFRIPLPCQKEAHQECPVCMGELTADSQVMLLPCPGARNGHLFHRVCAEQWLQRKAMCPICRTDVRTLLPRVTGSVSQHAATTRYALEQVTPRLVVTALPATPHARPLRMRRESFQGSG